jgi:hypothetical protein
LWLLQLGVGTLDGGINLAFENGIGLLPKTPLPVIDLVGMDVVLLGQFCHRLVAVQSGRDDFTILS